MSALSTLISVPTTAMESDEEDTNDCPVYVPTQSTDDIEQLGLNGVTCFQAGEYDWALTYYEAAHTLHPEPMLLGGIGRSLHELGLYHPAQAYYEKFLSREEETSRADRIRNRIDALEQSRRESSATLSLRGTPPGSTVYVVLDNGEWFELGTTPLEIDVAPGSYQFAFDAPMYRLRRVDVRARNDRTEIVDPALVSEQSAVDVSRRARRGAGVVTMGSSVVAATAATTLLLTSFQESAQARMLEEQNFDDLEDYDSRRSHHLDHATTTRRWGTALGVVSTAGLLAGAALYLTALPQPETAPPGTDDESQSATNSRLRLEPTVGLNQLGVRIQF